MTFREFMLFLRKLLPSFARQVFKHRRRSLLHSLAPCTSSSSPVSRPRPPSDLLPTEWWWTASHIRELREYAREEHLIAINGYQAPKQLVTSFSVMSTPAFSMEGHDAACGRPSKV